MSVNYRANYFYGFKIPENILTKYDDTYDIPLPNGIEIKCLGDLYNVGEYYAVSTYLNFELRDRYEVINLFTEWDRTSVAEDIVEQFGRSLGLSNSDFGYKLALTIS